MAIEKKMLIMSDEQFIEEVFEIAFGDNAINKKFGKREVLDRLHRYSFDAYRWERSENAILRKGQEDKHIEDYQDFLNTKYVYEEKQ